MKLMLVCLTLFALEFATTAFFSQAPASQTETVSEPSADQTAGIPLTKIIDIVARKTGKKYVLDPRVNAKVQLAGVDLNRLTYPELLTILYVYGYAAVESGGFVLVVPNIEIRGMAIPTLSGKETVPDYQYVSAVIPLTRVSAPALVPMLRPLMPTYGQLASQPCTNSLVMVDTYANVRRIESLIKALDVGEPYKPPKCELPAPKP